MGLTKNSTGLGAAGGDVALVKGSPDQRTAALAGNPNVAAWFGRLRGRGSPLCLTL